MSRHEAVAWKAPGQHLTLPSYISHTSYMAQMSHRSSHRPYGQASTFVYIVHLISIDLQSSRSLNSPTLQRLQYLLTLLCYTATKNHYTCLYRIIIPADRKFYQRCRALWRRDNPPYLESLKILFQSSISLSFALMKKSII